MAFAKGEKHPNWGKKLSEEIKKKISEAHKGRKCPWSNGKQNLGRKMTGRRQIGWKLSKESKANISKGHIGSNTWMKGRKLSEEWKKNIRKAVQQRVKEGLHNFWKGGLTPLNHAIRTSFEYRQWRSDVFTRDNFTCIWGGKKHSNRLEADHIKPFALILKENNIKTLEEALACEELWNINNGRTLCKECHKKTDTYGEKAKRF